MNILVIESSPHKHGSSNLLADSFIRGAEEIGHTVTVFDAGHAIIRPCLGCEVCGMSGPCCQKDDMAVSYTHLDVYKRQMNAHVAKPIDVAVLQATLGKVLHP